MKRFFLIVAALLAAPMLALALPALTARDSGTKVAVTTTSATVISANSHRAGWCVIADSENFHNVYLKLGATATTSNIRLKADASYCESTGYGDVANIYGGAIAVVTSYGGANVYTVEY